MIRKAWLKLIVLSVCWGARVALGQTGVAPQSAPVQAAPDVRLALSPTAQPRQATHTISSDLQPDNSNPPTGNAAPPPDPPLPEWGNYSQPEPVPVRLPPLSYELVGPPRGIVQPDTGQFYGQVLGDPIGLPETDTSLSQAIDLARPDGLAPVGMHGDHTLKAGRVLLSARYDQQTFDGNFVGSHPVSNASVLSQFPFAPTHLFQTRSTALVEYAPTDDLTMLFQLPFEHSQLDYLQSNGGSYTTSFTNPGDISITGLYALYRRPGQQIHLNLGLNIPVGFMDYLNVQPSPVVPNLPYVIRTSSGSYGLLPGLTYRGQNELWTWGAQATGTVPFGLNRLNYELGNSADVTAWLSRRWTPRWATSARLDAQFWGNVRRADGDLNTALSPTNDPNLQGGSRLNALFGINYYLPAGRIPGQVLSIEAGAPVFQSLDGPQLGLQWILVAGWNLLF